MSDDKTQELLPCPFCGRTPKRAYNFAYAHGTKDNPGYALWAVDHHCAPGHGKTKAEAIAAWNRRTPPAEDTP